MNTATTENFDFTAAAKVIGYQSEGGGFNVDEFVVTGQEWLGKTASVLQIFNGRGGKWRIRLLGDPHGGETAGHERLAHAVVRAIEMVRDWE